MCLNTLQVGVLNGGTSWVREWSKLSRVFIAAHPLPAAVAELGGGQHWGSDVWRLRLAMCSLFMWPKKKKKKAWRGQGGEERKRANAPAYFTAWVSTLQAHRKTFKLHQI